MALDLASISPDVDYGMAVLTARTEDLGRVIDLQTERKYFRQFFAMVATALDDVEKDLDQPTGGRRDLEREIFYSRERVEDLKTMLRRNNLLR